MIFHLGTRQTFRLASLSAVSLAVSLCALTASTEPKRLTDEQHLADRVLPPTLSPSGKIVDRLATAAELPEMASPARSAPTLVSRFEFFAPPQDVSLGLQATADPASRTPRPQIRSGSGQPKIISGQDKLVVTVIPPARPKDLDAVQTPAAPITETRAAPATVLGLKLPRVVSTAHTVIVRQVVAWGGTISHMAQGL